MQAMNFYPLSIIKLINPPPASLLGSLRCNLIKITTNSVAIINDLQQSEHLSWIIKTLSPVKRLNKAAIYDTTLLKFKSQVKKAIFLGSFSFKQFVSLFHCLGFIIWLLKFNHYRLVF